MTTTTTGAMISVISRDIDSITLPFEFELEVTGGLEKRGERDPAQLALLTGVWPVWWSHLALDLASPEVDTFPGYRRPRVLGKPAPALPREGAAPEAKLWDLGLVHPSELAGPGGGMEYRLAPFSRKRDVSSDLCVANCKF